MALRTFAFSIIAPPATLLAQVAAAMPVGTWAAFDGTSQNGVVATIPANIASMLAVGPVTQSIIPYCNKAAWNPVSNAIEVFGGDHSQAGGPFHRRYSESGHSFASGPVAQPGIVGHGFDHYAVNPYNGDLYWKDYAGGPLYRLANGAGSWTTLVSGGGFPSGISGNITYGCDWVNAGFFGTGAQGGFVIYSCYSDNIFIYDPLAPGWRPTITGPGIANSYHGEFNYSSVKNVGVFGGKDNSSTRLWRLASDGTITELTAPPLAWGITRAQMVADPVTGNFVMLQLNGMYELNPDGAGTWTLLTGSRARPSQVNANILNGNGAPGVVLVPLPEHGVIAALSAHSGTARMHLYKHA